MKVIIFVFIFLISLNYKLFSQDDCPPTINEPGWEDYFGITFEPIPMDIWGNVDAKARPIGPGQYEIKVDWTTLQNFGRYGITDAELKQMMYKAIMTAIAKDKNLCGENSGSLFFVFYEKTQCKVLKHCYLKVDKNKQILCADDGWPGPDPSFFEYQNEKYYRINTEVPCGIQCCKINYIVECKPTTNGASQYYLHILTKGKTPYPGSECDTTNYYDCLTGEPEPCQSTCK